MSNSKDRLSKLEAIEQQLVTALQNSGQAFSELSKDKPSQKNVENYTNQFLKTLENVEADINQQINYLTQVSTGQPHEGSSYASQKVLHMAWHRYEHLRQRLIELEKLKINHQMQLQQFQSSMQSAQFHQQQHPQQQQQQQLQQPTQQHQQPLQQQNQQQQMNPPVYQQPTQQMLPQQQQY